MRLSHDIARQIVAVLGSTLGLSVSVVDPEGCVLASNGSAVVGTLLAMLALGRIAREDDQALQQGAHTIVPLHAGGSLVGAVVIHEPPARAAQLAPLARTVAELALHQAHQAEQVIQAQWLRDRFVFQLLHRSLDATPGLVEHEASMLAIDLALPRVVVLIERVSSEPPPAPSLRPLDIPIPVEELAAVRAAMDGTEQDILAMLGAGWLALLAVVDLQGSIARNEVSRMRTDKHRAAQVVGVVSALYGIHSLLASNQVKALVRQWLGPRYDDGLYRFAFTTQSVGSALAGLVWFLRQPDQELYHLRGRWMLLARGIQLGGIIILLDVLRVVGPFRMLGLGQVVAVLRKRVPPPTPVAQGPPRGRGGAMDARGLFRYIRHPDNLPAVLLFLGFPRMTWNRLALAVATVLYAVIGSLLEDARLRQAYGAAFRRYEREVPLLVPRLPRRASRSTGEPRPEAHS